MNGIQLTYSCDWVFLISYPVAIEGIYAQICALIRLSVSCPGYDDNINIDKIFYNNIHQHTHRFYKRWLLLFWMNKRIQCVDQICRKIVFINVYRELWLRRIIIYLIYYYHNKRANNLIWLVINEKKVYKKYAYDVL